MSDIATCKAKGWQGPHCESCMEDWYDFGIWLVEEEVDGETIEVCCWCSARRRKAALEE